MSDHDSEYDSEYDAFMHGTEVLDSDISAGFIIAYDEDTTKGTILPEQGGDEVFFLLLNVVAKQKIGDHPDRPAIIVGDRVAYRPRLNQDTGELWVCDWVGMWRL